MKASFIRPLVLLAVLAAVFTGSPSQPAFAANGQTASAQQQPAPPPKSTPKKKPEEPIDPDNSAGVRGSGSKHTVRVLSKGKPVQSAHVVVKNTDGSLAGSCYTNASGECQLDLGADSYRIIATKNSFAGNVTQQVDDSTGPIIIKLAKVKTEAPAPKT